MKRFLYVIAYIPIVVLIFLLLEGCSESPPQIDQLEWRVVFRDSDFKREELMLFLRVSDPDDNNDPNEVSIVADGTDFQWRFERNVWMPVNISGEELWGMPAILSPYGSSLPNVLYRVRLTDLAGQSVEKTFRLTTERFMIEDVDWPEVNISENTLLYSGKYTEPIMILRSEDYSVIESKIASNQNIISDNVSWWEIWINLGDIGSAIRLGPYPFRLE